MKIEILNRWSNAVIYTHEAEGATMRDAVVAWLGSFGDVAQYILAACKVAESGCVEWQLSTTRGRGRITLAGKRVYVHRALWELAIGPVEGDLLVCHGCDNALCVNPAHMFLGTHEDNMRDMVAKGRSTKGRSLSPERRLEIGMAQRGKQHSPETRAAISRGVRAHHDSMVAAFGSQAVIEA